MNANELFAVPSTESLQPLGSGLINDVQVILTYVHSHPVDLGILGASVLLLFLAAVIGVGFLVRAARNRIKSGWQNPKDDKALKRQGIRT